MVIIEIDDTLFINIASYTIYIYIARARKTETETYRERERNRETDRDEEIVSTITKVLKDRSVKQNQT